MSPYLCLSHLCLSHLRLSAFICGKKKPGAGLYRRETGLISVFIPSALICVYLRFQKKPEAGLYYHYNQGSL
jgi:hypothetical protein